MVRLLPMMSVNKNNMLIAAVTDCTDCTDCTSGTKQYRYLPPGIVALIDAYAGLPNEADILELLELRTLRTSLLVDLWRVRSAPLICPFLGRLI